MPASNSRQRFQTKIFCNQFVSFSLFEDTALLYSPGRSDFLRSPSSLFDIMRIFLRTFDEASNSLQIPLPKPKTAIGSTLQSQKTAFWLSTMKIALNIQIDKFVYRPDSETTNLVFSPSKRLNYAVFKLYLKKLSNLTIAELTASTRTDIRLQTSVK